MAVEDAKKVGMEVSSEPAPPATPPAAETPKDVAEEKEVNSTPPAAAEAQVDDSKALTVVDKVADPPEEKKAGSVGRDAVLMRVETEKKMSLVKAWEENAKTKAENKAIKKMSAISAWENSKKATIEAELKKIEEALEKKKGEYAEKMNNKIAHLHKEAEEKRAVVEAKRGEQMLKAEETAAKYRATGVVPKKIFGWFGA